MRINIDLAASQEAQCQANNCPASFPVIGEPGGRVHIGRKLRDLDPDTWEQLKDRIGDGEEAYWIPAGLE